MKVNSNCRRFVFLTVLALVFAGNSLSNPTGADDTENSLIPDETGTTLSGEIEQAADGTKLARKKRFVPLAVVAAGASVTTAIVSLTTLIAKMFDPSCRGYGCNEGYCWAYCSIGNQWCYTTRKGTLKGDYVKCDKDEDCNGCWKCRGLCTI